MIKLQPTHDSRAGQHQIAFLLAAQGLMLNKLMSNTNHSSSAPRKR
jgi:hypothetical protein